MLNQSHLDFDLDFDLESDMHLVDVSASRCPL